MAVPRAEALDPGDSVATALVPPPPAQPTPPTAPPGGASVALSRATRRRPPQSCCKVCWSGDRRKARPWVPGAPPPRLLLQGGTVAARCSSSWARYSLANALHLFFPGQLKLHVSFQHSLLLPHFSCGGAEISIQSSFLVPCVGRLRERRSFHCVARPPSFRFHGDRR